MVKISRIQLMRRKSVHSTAKSAWKDISSKLNIKPSEVIAKHTSKAWMWKPKPKSKFIFLAPGEKKSGSTSKSKKSRTKKSKNKVTVKTSRKDFDMCKKIDDALKNKNVKEIIIKK